MTENPSLASLHTAIVDAHNGYEEAIRRAELPELKVIFQRLNALHETARAELHKALLARGFTPDESGSFMSTVHKTVISVRSVVAGLDAESLSSFASGEERIVEEYDKAIDDNASDESLVALLERQEAKLKSAISDMRATATGAKTANAG
jgi:uncharacterized protein (TIGR02284 family)